MGSAETQIILTLDTARATTPIECILKKWLKLLKRVHGIKCRSVILRPAPDGACLPTE